MEGPWRSKKDKEAPKETKSSSKQSKQKNSKENFQRKSKSNIEEISNDIELACDDDIRCSEEIIVGGEVTEEPKKYILVNIFNTGYSKRGTARCK